MSLVVFTVSALSAGTAVGQATDPRGSDVFGDVPVGYWADGEVGWGVTDELSWGVGGGRFGLDGAATRAQIVSSVYRTVQVLQGVTSGLEGMIVFESDRDGDWEVFVMNADGTNQRQITDNTSDDRLPGWSPDGTRIVFTSDRDGDYEIFVMNADGTNQQQLTDNTSDDRLPGWSPDGTQIAFISNRDGDSEIFVMSADGTNQKQLTDNSNFDRMPGWSPDGTQIAFHSNRDGDWEVFVMNADGTNQRQITDNTSPDWTPRWSPDGTRIVFTSNRDGDFEVFVMNADGTNQRQITDNFSTDWTPVWSPDGTRIVFTSDRDGDYEIFVMNADGTNQQQLTSNSDTEFVYGLAWWSQTPSRESHLFEDVPEGHFAEDAIRWAAEEEITVGVGNNQFGIGQTLTRYEMVTFLCRVFATGTCRSGTRGSDTFGDVPVDHWANYAIGWAVENGITSGVSATEFGGPQTLTREEIAAFLWRAKGRPAGGSLGSDVYTDVPADRSQWANQPIGWAYDQGISGGTASGTFGFGTSLTREEMVLFLCRAIASGTCTPSQTPIPPSGAGATAPPTTIIPDSKNAVTVEVAAGEAVTIHLSSLFGDPDGDELVYEAATSDAAVAVVSVSGSELTITGAGEGAVTVTVTARDPGGLAAEQNFEVAVSVRISVDETATVQVLYAVPADRELRADYREGIEHLLVDVQSWYRQQLEGLTFSLYGDVPQLCEMSEPADFYGRYSWQKIVDGVQHCAPVAAGTSSFVWIVYADVVHECGPYEQGYDQLGRGGDGLTILTRWDLDGLIGEDGLYHYCDGDELFGPYDRPLSSWQGGTAHELGHAFGLPHPPGCDAGLPTCDTWAMMQNGYETYPHTYLRADDKEALIRSPFIDTRSSSGPRPAAAPAESRVQGSVSGPGGSPVEGARVSLVGEDFWAWAATGADGAFEIAVPEGSSGTAVVSVHAGDAAACRWLGYHDGSGGITALRQHAQPFGIGDSDTSGVAIALPASVDEMCRGPRTITGTVLGPDAAPVQEVWVGHDSTSEWALTDADGSFEIRLPDGTLGPSVIVVESPACGFLDTTYGRASQPNTTWPPKSGPAASTSRELP